MEAARVIIEIGIHTPDVVDSEAVHHAASGLPPVSERPIAEVPPQVLQEALNAAHEVNQRLQRQLEAQARLLQSRTIERDHFKQDSYLWGLIVAWLVNEQGNEDGWSITTAELQHFHGRAIQGHEEDGVVTVTIGEPLPPSEEGQNG